jgi:hypothetical protein
VGLETASLTLGTACGWFPLGQTYQKRLILQCLSANRRTRAERETDYSRTGFCALLRNSQAEQPNVRTLRFPIEM